MGLQFLHPEGTQRVQRLHACARRRSGVRSPAVHRSFAGGFWPPRPRRRPFGTSRQPADKQNGWGSAVCDGACRGDQDVRRAALNGWLARVLRHAGLDRLLRPRRWSGVLRGGRARGPPRQLPGARTRAPWGWLADRGEVASEPDGDGVEPIVRVSVSGTPDLDVVHQFAKPEFRGVLSSRRHRPCGAWPAGSESTSEALGLWEDDAVTG